MLKFILTVIIIFSFINEGHSFNNLLDSAKNKKNTEKVTQKAKDLKNEKAIVKEIANEKYYDIKSNYLPIPGKVLVITPKNYSKTKCPLVFMLHGWSGDQDQWKTTADLHYYADKYKFIIVCPDGLYDSWYVNNPINKKVKYEKYFFEDLYKTIKANYQIDTKNIFITGLSMGGFGAMNFFLNNPKFFKGVATTSGILDITKFKGKWGMEKVFSEMDYSKYSPINNLYKIKNLDKTILVDCGEQDFAFNANKAFYQKCREMNIPIKFYSGPGNHSHSYWKKSVERHFELFYMLANKT